MTERLELLHSIGFWIKIGRNAAKDGVTLDQVLRASDCSNENHIAAIKVGYRNQRKKMVYHERKSNSKL